MSELRFDGRVAVVTGAGRGIGRAYALLLASRGAAVVVNDLGGSIEGEGTDGGPAEAVVAEIEGAGGSAVADINDVSTGPGGSALVDAAVSSFGRIDVVVNNAGIMRWAGFPELDDEALDAHLAVHVGGTFHTMRAAWPHLAQQGHGRIVNTTSTGVLGLAANTAYASAKGGVIGMTRSAAVAGRKLGIKVNCIAPAASTRMGGEGGPDMPPELVAPIVAYLAHDDCPVSGEVYVAGAGRFQRLFIATTPGWVADGPVPTIEDVVSHWEAINDEPGYAVPANLMAWSRDFLSHLPPAPPDA